MLEVKIAIDFCCKNDIIDKNRYLKSYQFGIDCLRFNWFTLAGLVVDKSNANPIIGLMVFKNIPKAREILMSKKLSFNKMIGVVRWEW